MLTAVSRLLPAVASSPSAVTTPATGLAPGLAERSEIAVCSVASAALRLLVCVCHSPFACVMRAVRSVWTCARLDLISVTSPLLTLLWVRVWIEVRRSAASWHTSEVAVGDAEAVPDGLVLLAGLLPELQATASSPAPSATATVDHQVGPVPVFGLIFMPASSS